MGLGEIFAGAAAAAGLAGAVAALALAPRRGSPAVLVLLLGFALLVAGAALRLPDTGFSQPAISRFVFVGAGAVIAVGAVLAIAEGRGMQRDTRIAVADADAQRREVQRLTGTNVRLEDETKELRARVIASERTQGDSARTEREASAQRLRRALETAQVNERRHRAVFTGAFEGMAILERETLRMSEVNDSLVRMTGYTREELTQRALVDLFAAGDDQPGKADLQRCAREGRTLTLVLQRKEGGIAHAEISVTVVGAGNDAQLLAVVRDVSERATIESDLARQLSERSKREESLLASEAALERRVAALEDERLRLQDQHVAKDHFLSSVSHELRTPLTSIRSFSEILLKHGDTEPSVRREFLEIIHKESERLTRMVNNVLDLARIEAGEARLALSEFDMRAVIDDSVASMAGMAAERRVTLVRECGDVPRPLCGDRDKVQQLVVNVLSNAIKFSDEGGSVHVTVGEGSSPGRVLVSVADRGIGIPADHLERIFEKFHQVEDAQAAQRAVGTGLGLAICREIVVLHGGRIWAESTLGEGAVFHFEMPALVESRKALGYRPGTPPAARTATGLDRPHTGAPAPASPRPAPPQREVFEDDVTPILEPAARADTAPRRAGRDRLSSTGSLPPLARSTGKTGEIRGLPPL